MSIFYDFLPMWAAGRAIRLGANPYDPVVVASILYDALKSDGQILNSWPGGFMYPPWSLWIFFIFSLPPLGIAKDLWSFIACSSILLVVRHEFSSKELIRRVPIIFLATALIAFLPLTKQILFGQSSWIILLTTYYSWQLFQKGNYRSAGILLGIAQVKSHVLLGFSAFMVACALKKGRLIFLIYVITTFAIECGSAILLDSNAFTDFLNMIVTIASNKPHAPRAATIDFMNCIFQVDIPRRFATLLSFYGILGALLVGMSGESEQNRNKALLISLLTAPFCWVNDYLILLPAYLGYVGATFRYNKKFTLILSGILALSGVWISGSWENREVWGWVYLPLFMSYLLNAPQCEIEPTLQVVHERPLDMKGHPILNYFRQWASTLHIVWAFIGVPAGFLTGLSLAITNHNYTLRSLVEVPMVMAGAMLFISLMFGFLEWQVEHLARYVDSSKNKETVNL